jgi:hypothetical protein
MVDTFMVVHWQGLPASSDDSDAVYNSPGHIPAIP